MSARLVFAALIVMALAVGFVAGTATPRDQEATRVTSTGGQAADEALAQVAVLEDWLMNVSAAAIAGRLDGVSVGVLVADGAEAEDVEAVTQALKSAGAQVGLEASLSAEWWTPELASFRGEIADQVAQSVVGAEGLSSTELLQHAIIQALVPGAVPADVAGQGDVQAEPGEGVVAADGAEVLLEVLTRSGLLTVDRAAEAPVSALVVVTADGPEGAGTIAAVAAGAWENYVPATLIVTFGSATAPSVATDAISQGEALAADARPSVVVATEPSLVDAQVVLAVVEQLDGGAGSYGIGENLDLIAQP